MPVYESQSTPVPPGGNKPFDPRHSMRMFLALDAWARLILWAGAGVLTVLLFNRFDLWPHEPPLRTGWRAAYHWGWCAIGLAFAYNTIYVLLLILLRLPIPRPREGTYPLGAHAKPGRDLVAACFIAVLTKARYEPPFPGFLVHHMASLPPQSWLMARIFGPSSRSLGVTDARILDPAMVTIGRNVVIGLGAIISGHWQERDSVTIRRTIIEDDVLIGGCAVIFGGVRIGRGAMIGASAVVLPNTVVGENEFWAGIPARKLRDLPRVDSLVPPASRPAGTPAA
ncbi:MAG: DapH/DapD/GlmU-related protein [Phycisphaerae bacterium]